MWHFKGACAKNLGWGGDLGLGAGEVSGDAMEGDGEASANAGGRGVERGILARSTRGCIN